MSEDTRNLMDIAEIHKLATESVFHDADLDLLDTQEILEVMNDQDALVAERVRGVIPAITKAVDEIAPRFERGGRLIYVGAGTSGRLGVLDAAECPPTFGVIYDAVVGVIAGGDRAIRFAVEHAEDDGAKAENDLEKLHLTGLDSVVGISASGRTPYVIAALHYARRCRAFTVTLSNNIGSQIGSISDVAIEVGTGPEVLSGSTRLKAGTAQKLVLNMISTAVMVKNGKVFKNLMVDVKPTNEKLVDRAKRIVGLAVNVSLEDAQKLYNMADGNVKAAIIMGLTGVPVETAQQLLAQGQGFVRNAIALHDQGVG